MVFDERHDLVVVVVGQHMHFGAGHRTTTLLTDQLGLQAHSTHTYTHTHIHTHTNTYTHIHTYTYTHTAHHKAHTETHQHTTPNNAHVVAVCGVCCRCLAPVSSCFVCVCVVCGVLCCPCVCLCAAHVLLSMCRTWDTTMTCASCIAICVMVMSLDTCVSITERYCSTKEARPVP